MERRRLAPLPDPRAAARLGRGALAVARRRRERFGQEEQSGLVRPHEPDQRLWLGLGEAEREARVETSEIEDHGLDVGPHGEEGEGPAARGGAQPPGRVIHPVRQLAVADSRVGRRLDQGRAPAGVLPDEADQPCIPPSTPSTWPVT